MQARMVESGRGCIATRRGMLLSSRCFLIAVSLATSVSVSRAELMATWRTGRLGVLEQKDAMFAQRRVRTELRGLKIARHLLHGIQVAAFSKPL